MTTVADFGFKPWPTAAALKAAGITGAIQYVAGGSESKHITSGQYAGLRAAGLDVALVWEQAARTLGTVFDAAGAAREALAAAEALRYTGVIYWAADWDVQSAEWPRVRDNMRAVCGVLGVARTGLYSSYDAIGWAARDGVASRFWQSMSTAFSGGRNAHPHPAAHLWQRRQTSIGGADVDLNDILQPNWAGEEPDMEQTDKVTSPSNPKSTRGNYVGDILADVGAERDWWYTVPGRGEDSKNPPPPGSRLDLAYRALTSPPAPAPVELTDAQLQTVANQVAAQLGGKLDALTAKLGEILVGLSQALDG